MSTTTTSTLLGKEDLDAAYKIGSEIGRRKTFYSRLRNRVSKLTLGLVSQSGPSSQDIAEINAIKDPQLRKQALKGAYSAADSESRLEATYNLLLNQASYELNPTVDTIGVLAHTLVEAHGKGVIDMGSLDRRIGGLIAEHPEWERKILGKAWDGARQLNLYGGREVKSRQLMKKYEKQIEEYQIRKNVKKAKETLAQRQKNHDAEQTDVTAHELAKALMEAHVVGVIDEAALDKSIGGLIESHPEWKRYILEGAMMGAPRGSTLEDEYILRYRQAVLDAEPIAGNANLLAVAIVHRYRDTLDTNELSERIDGLIGKHPQWEIEILSGARDAASYSQHHDCHFHLRLREIYYKNEPTIDNAKKLAGAVMRVHREGVIDREGLDGRIEGLIKERPEWECDILAGAKGEAYIDSSTYAEYNLKLGLAKYDKDRTMDSASGLASAIVYARAKGMDRMTREAVDAVITGLITKHPEWEEQILRGAHEGAWHASSRSLKKKYSRMIDACNSREAAAKQAAEQAETKQAASAGLGTQQEVAKTLQPELTIAERVALLNAKSTTHEPSQ